METKEFNIIDARKAYNARQMINYYKRKEAGTLKTIIPLENQKKRGRPFKIHVEVFEPIEPKILMKRERKPKYDL